MTTECPSSGCMVNLNANIRAPAELCGDPAPYRMRIRGCAICRQIGCEDCSGHPACLAHTAAMRADGDLRDRGKPTGITRISGAPEIKTVGITGPATEENDG